MTGLAGVIWDFHALWVDVVSVSLEVSARPDDAASVWLDDAAALWLEDAAPPCVRGDGPPT